MAIGFGIGALWLLVGGFLALAHNNTGVMIGFFVAAVVFGYASRESNRWAHEEKRRR
jgi:hypothetical protein